MERYQTFTVLPSPVSGTRVSTENKVNMMLALSELGVWQGR
jgi:hypothetical protein